MEAFLLFPSRLYPSLLMPIRLRHRLTATTPAGSRWPFVRIGLRLSHGKTELFVAPLSLSIVIAVLDQVECVTLPEQYRLQERPHLLVAPVLAQDIGWVHRTCDVVE